jgi:hypothetical protein
MFPNVNIAQGKEKTMVPFWQEFEQEHLLYKVGVVMLCNSSGVVLHKLVCA